MKTDLAKKRPASFTPRDKPYEVRDISPGLILRVQPSGTRTYYCEWARGKRIKIGRADIITPSAARKKALTFLAQAATGEAPTRKKPKVHTLESFITDEYAPWASANRKTGAATVARLRACFAEFSGKPLNEVNVLAVDKWRSGRIRDGIKPATVNRDLTALKAAFSKAVEWGFLAVHPLAKVKPARVDDRAVVRYLLEDEERRLRAALTARDDRLRESRARGNAWREARGYESLQDLSGVRFADYLHPIVLLAINTGLRRGELFHLRWADVDLARASVTARGSKAKAGTTRHVPLNDEAKQALEDWKEQTEREGLVFPGRSGGPLDNIKKAWAAVLAEAGIENFRFHDLRHTFASKLVMAGVDLNTVRELMGHSDIKMTLRYAHLAPEHKAEAVSRLVPSLR